MCRCSSWRSAKTFTLRRKWYLWPDPIFEHAQSSSRFVFLANQICQIWQWVRELWTSGVGASQRSRSLVQKGSWARGPDNSDSETQTQCYSCIWPYSCWSECMIYDTVSYPFPSRAGTIGLFLFSATWLHTVHLVLYNVPKNNKIYNLSKEKSYHECQASRGILLGYFVYVLVNFQCGFYCVSLRTNFFNILSYDFIISCILRKYG